MKSIVGSPGERWPLARAVDALVAAARGAGVPGPLWAAGIAYPLTWVGVAVLADLRDLLSARVGEDVAPLRALVESAGLLSPGLLPRPGAFLAEGAAIAVLLLRVALVLPAARLAAGLAAVSAPEAWSALTADRRTPTLGDAWRAGAGLGRAACGLLLAAPLLLFAAELVLAAPLVAFPAVLRQLVGLPGLLLLLLVPLAAVLVGYGVLLQVLVQLALQSLTKNRRGTASALAHAWRLAKHAPLGTVRAALVDVLLQLAMLLLYAFLRRVLGRDESLGWLLTPGEALWWLLWGYVNVTRAGYWARTYEGLGGLATIPWEERLAPARPD